MDIKKLNEDLRKSIDLINNKKALREEKQCLSVKGNVKETQEILKNLAKTFGDNTSIKEVIKNLKEDLKEDRNGFSFSGKNKDIQQLLQDLTNEYGNLTIPEFIDALMNKEASQNLIAENLIHEDTRLDQSKEAWKLNVETFINEICKTKSKIYTNVPWRKHHNDDYKYATARLEFIKCDNSIEVHFAGKDNRIFDIEFHEIQENGYIPADSGYISFSIIPQYEVGNYYYLDYDLEKQLRKCFDKEGELSIRQVRGRMYYFNTYSKKEPCLEFDSIDDKKERKYFVKKVVDIVTKAVDAAVEQLRNNVQKQDDEFNSSKNKFAELSAAKRQARANKRAANTTIKQALSKTAVIKKIQALQDVTPEQLAKILAAIEE